MFQLKKRTRAASHRSLIRFEPKQRPLPHFIYINKKDVKFLHHKLIYIICECINMKNEIKCRLYYVIFWQDAKNSSLWCNGNSIICSMCGVTSSERKINQYSNVMKATKVKRITFDSVLVVRSSFHGVCRGRLEGSTWYFK